MRTIGKRIVDLREGLNMKQKDLAEAIGVTKATMCKYENDRNIPNADVLKALSAALHTTADYLIGNSAVPIPGNDLFLSPDDRELVQLVLSLSPEDKIRIAERALTLSEKHR